MAVWKTENYRDRNHISGCQGLGVERRGWITKRYERTIRMRKIFLYLD